MATQIILCGASLLTDAIEASLRNIAAFEVERLDLNQANTAALVAARQPTVVIVEMPNDCVNNDLIITLLRQRLPVIGVDLANSELVVMSSSNIHAGAVADLERVVRQVTARAEPGRNNSLGAF